MSIIQYMSEIGKLHTGELYLPGDNEISELQDKCLDLLDEFNRTPRKDREKRLELLGRMFMSFGKDSWIEAPVHANWAGRFTSIGNHVWINFGLTLVDDTYITIGDNTQLGPNVTIATATHPLDPILRKEGYQSNKPVTIGSNVWIGAGAIILPGVTIGDDSVIGAGSIVTKDVPPSSVAVGNPARVIRRVND